MNIKGTSKYLEKQIMKILILSTKNLQTKNFTRKCFIFSWHLKVNKHKKCIEFNIKASVYLLSSMF